MKIVCNEKHEVVGVEILPPEGHVAYETDVFDGWPLAKVFCYCYEERGDEGVAVYPFVNWPACERAWQEADAQEEALGVLGVAARQAPGQAQAVRQAMDKAGRLVPRQDAAEMAALYGFWQAGNEYEAGARRRFGGRLFECRQAHAAREEWAPDAAPALWLAFDEEHAGTREDPVPAMLGMAVERGKYYLQSEVLYVCTRDSGGALYHMPGELVGVYFEVAAE